MLAKKDNKVYDIDASQQSRYSKQGFDIYQDNGDLVCYADTKTIKYNKHEEIVKQKDEIIKKLSAEIKSKDEMIKKLENELKAKAEK